MTPLFSSVGTADFVQLRGLAWAALSETGLVRRGTVTDDSGGGGSLAFNTVGTYPCRVDPFGSRSGVFGGRVDERTTHIITLPPDTDVTEADRFRVGSTDFEITAVRERTNEAVRELEATTTA